MARVLASLFVGLSAVNIALASGVVFWRHWPPGDAADIGFTAALATFYLLSPRRQPRNDRGSDVAECDGTCCRGRRASEHGGASAKSEARDHG